MPSFNKSASYPLPRINDGPDMAGWIASKTWHRASLLFVSRSAFGPLPTLFTPDTPVTRVTLVTRCTVTGYTVSAYQRISASSYQHISVSTFQHISVSTFQRIDVPAYQRTGVPAHQRITLQACNLSRTQQNSVSASNHVRTRIATTLLFSRFVAALAFVANGRVWLQNAKKSRESAPDWKSKESLKKQNNNPPPKKLQPLLNKKALRLLLFPVPCSRR